MFQIVSGSQILACTELVKEATDTVAQVAAIEEVC